MDLPIINSNGVSYFIVDGPPLDYDRDPFTPAKYAVNMDILHGLGSRGQYSSIAQLYGLVIPGMILSVHLFQGLNRNLYDGGFDGDSDKFVFSRKPAYDFYWKGCRNGEQVKCMAPPGQVFVILVSGNTKQRDKENFSDVDGWIDHWTWVDQDTILSEAPINWVDRYKTKVWSREN